MCNNGQHLLTVTLHAHCRYKIYYKKPKASLEASSEAPLENIYKTLIPLYTADEVLTSASFPVISVLLMTQI